MRPRSAGEILDAGITAAVRTFAQATVLVAIALAISLPNLASLFLPKANAFPVQIVAVLVTFPFLTIPFAALFVLYGRAMTGTEATGWREALRGGAPRWWRILLLQLVVVFVFFVLLLIPAFAFGFAFGFARAQHVAIGASPVALVSIAVGAILGLVSLLLAIYATAIVNVAYAVCVFEQRGVRASIARAFRRCTGKNALRALAIGFAMLMAPLVPALAYAFASSSMPSASAWLGCISNIVQVFAWLPTAAWGTALALDGRLRDEGYDLELAAQTLAATPGSGSDPSPA